VLLAPRGFPRTENGLHGTQKKLDGKTSPDKERLDARETRVDPLGEKKEELRGSTTNLTNQKRANEAAQ